MKTLGNIMAAAALLIPVVVSAPSEAKTAFQYWAQGRGVYVSSKDHPRGGLQDAAQEFGGLPRSAPDAYHRRDVPPPYGYSDPDD